MVEVYNLHGWNVSIAESRELQVKLAAQVSKKNEVTAPRSDDTIESDSCYDETSPNGDREKPEVVAPGVNVMTTA